jgi:hypothetical protein
VIAQTGIPGISEPSQTRLIQRLAACPQVQSVWLLDSLAMGHHHSGSDSDLCLEALKLSHADRLRSMAAMDDMLVTWLVDLLLRYEMAENTNARINRVGRCLGVCI